MDSSDQAKGHAEGKYSTNLLNFFCYSESRAELPFVLFWDILLNK